MPGWFENLAEEDFARARMRELLSRISRLLDPEREKLLPFDEVKAILRPASEIYVGMEAVEVDKIVGSEGRYRDFNRHFLPRRESSNLAGSASIWLIITTFPFLPFAYSRRRNLFRQGREPPSLGRPNAGPNDDRCRGDELDTLIDLKPGMTLEELKRGVIEYEKRRFYEKFSYGVVTGDDALEFTSTGRYDQILEHILVHKYYLNQGMSGEIPFPDALWSWHENVYNPVVAAIWMKASYLVSRDARPRISICS